MFFTGKKNPRGSALRYIYPNSKTRLLGFEENFFRYKDKDYDTLPV